MHICFLMYISLLCTCICNVYLFPDLCYVHAYVMYVYLSPDVYIHSMLCKLIHVCIMFFCLLMYMSMICMYIHIRIMYICLLSLYPCYVCMYIHIFITYICLLIYISMLCMYIHKCIMYICRLMYISTLCVYI